MMCLLQRKRKSWQIIWEWKILQSIEIKAQHPHCQIPHIHCILRRVSFMIVYVFMWGIPIVPKRMDAESTNSRFLLCKEQRRGFALSESLIKVALFKYVKARHLIRQSRNKTFRHLVLAPMASHKTRKQGVHSGLCSSSKQFVLYTKVTIAYFFALEGKGSDMAEEFLKF